MARRQWRILRNAALFFLWGLAFYFQVMSGVKPLYIADALAVGAAAGLVIVVLRDRVKDRSRRVQAELEQADARCPSCGASLAQGRKWYQATRWCVACGARVPRPAAP